MKILIVEDDYISRSILNRMLTEMGNTVLEAEDGEQGWELLKSNEIKMVISDWMMPAMNGLDLCRKIRLSDLHHYVYVIMLTAKDRQSDRVDVFKAGADDYVAKPFDPEELRARVTTGMRVIDLEERHNSLSRKLNEKLVSSTARIEAQDAKLKSALQQVEAAQAQMIQSEKMAAIGQLTAGVAHEINNPTGFVNSNLKTLLDYQQDLVRLIKKYGELIAEIECDENCSSIPTSIKKSIKKIKSFEDDIDLTFIVKDIVDLIGDCREGTARIKQIVLDLKDFVHPGEDEIQPVNINHGLESTLNVVHNVIKYKATVNKDFGDLPVVKGYPQQLNQVFMNLLVNAAQAIEKKGEIAIKTRRVDNHVEITISDTGCGIPRENLKKIFDPFFTTKDVGKGTGLGMNIAYHIIQKHNGALEVESQVGRGTTFCIRLPLDSNKGPAVTVD